MVGKVADRLFTPPTKNVPGGDLEGGTKDLRSNEFCHDDDDDGEEESVFCSGELRGGCILGSGVNRESFRKLVVVLVVEWEVEEVGGEVEVGKFG